VSHLSLVATIAQNKLKYYALLGNLAEELPELGGGGGCTIQGLFSTLPFPHVGVWQGSVAMQGSVAVHGAVAMQGVVAMYRVW
jgi:hypothetical protein